MLRSDAGCDMMTDSGRVFPISSITSNCCSLSRRAFRVRSIILFVLMTSVASLVSAQEPAQEPEAKRWAVILTGLPGDDEHDALFSEAANNIQTWLVETLQFPAEQVVRLPKIKEGETVATTNVTAEGVRKGLADIESKLQPNDTLWVFTLGHGHYDGRRAWWHVAGRDPSDEDFGRWLSGIKCREQVIWLTHSSSGWFVKPLSKPGRIVIAATAADDESNETEFPHALATVAKLPKDKLDRNQDQQVSVAELFEAVTAEVIRRFKQDERLPTEHAQLEDDGDGRGSEDLNKPPTPTMKVDGELARKTFVPYREPKQP